MSPNVLSIPLSRLLNVDERLLINGINQLNLKSVAVYWCIDSKFRKSVFVRQWLDDWLVQNQEFLLTTPSFAGSKRIKIRQAVSWMKKNVTWMKDTDKWNMTDKWQTPQETMVDKTGDCEDGALLLYVLLRANGISDDELFIIASPVVGGGHCYLSWISDEDAVEYVIDWCYGASAFTIPYGLDEKYFFGSKEYFRFNSSGSYITK